MFREEAVRDHQHYRLAYERTGNRQFMSARLSSAEPQTRELSDDLESFLVLLWVAISYAPGTKTAKARADVLRVFDDTNPAEKRRFVSSGKSSVPYETLHEYTTNFMGTAAFPLFATPLYAGLGYHWASSLFGFIAVRMVPILHSIPLGLVVFASSVLSPDILRTDAAREEPLREYRRSPAELSS
ncbi:hypothetical protein B0H11DRAFT_2221197 [Mycena galericulata]|nr:hypothetical protein B0H11DRAFT_2221197 [Mycena galericulata]